MNPTALLKVVVTALSDICNANLFAYDQKLQHAVLSSKKIFDSADIARDPLLQKRLSRYDLNCEEVDSKIVVIYEDGSAFQAIISLHKSPVNGKCHLFVEIGMQ